jgi:hypothetical protein
MEAATITSTCPSLLPGGSKQQNRRKRLLIDQSIFLIVNHRVFKLRLSPVRVEQPRASFATGELDLAMNRWRETCQSQKTDALGGDSERVPSA